ncbi:hypothetical protein VNO78_01663 [Psophocarpus tetragonolobus]|uniref:TH1 domain-containing protein n=1 Tax=Psophocarpus tetragonolobus TaxID=3891 RepID=A0AAN9T0M0_PSOTE
MDFQYGLKLKSNRVRVESGRNNEREPAGWGPLDQNTVLGGRVQIDDPEPEPPQNDDVPDDDSSPVQRDEPDNQEKLCKRDYIRVPSRPYLMKLLNKQGDQIVLFADKVLKFTGSGKIKCRFLLITDFAIYLVDPETDSLQRRIALAAVEKIFLSELTDNFLAVIIPTEYDLLIASARKNEILTAFVEACELEVVSSNRFEYNAASDLVKEIEFEEVEGGVKTRILRKKGSSGYSISFPKHPIIEAVSICLIWSELLGTALISLKSCMQMVKLQSKAVVVFLLATFNMNPVRGGLG